MLRPRFVLAVALALSSGSATEAQIALLKTTTAPSGLVNLVSATFAPGSPTTLFFVEQNGRIQALAMLSSNKTAQPFMVLDNANFPGSNLSVVNETGLLGLAFHPNYQINGLFYTYYTAESGTEFRVDQFQAVGGVVQAGQRKNVVTASTPTISNLKHAGGWIGFAPNDGTSLYVAVGDGPYVLTADGGDPENNAQDTSKLLGKMLRIDVGTAGLDFQDPSSTYSIPLGNMTVNPNGNLTNPAPPSLTVRPEIFAYGLRNPWRASFDSQTGDLYIGDVGQRAREEINFIPASRENTATLDQTPGSLNGINLGWKLREGDIATPGVGSEELRNDNVDPIFDYVRTGTAGRFRSLGTPSPQDTCIAGRPFPTTAAT